MIDGRIIRWAVFCGQEQWSQWFATESDAKREMRELEKETRMAKLRVEYAPKNPINPPIRKEKQEQHQEESPSKPKKKIESRKERLARKFKLTVAERKSA